MQLNHTEHHSAEISESVIHTLSVIPEGNYLMTEESSQTTTEPTQFHSRFIDHMELYADAGTVAGYFDVHQEWFRRCAHPMAAEPIGDTGYALVIGRFGSFGYEVEPKIGLNLLPQNAGVYRIETIAVPDYESLGYEVDFKAAMELVEIQPDESDHPEMLQGTDLTQVTRVQWDLDLTVTIQFPRFIHALPKSLIQSTGDQLLKQIVRQVSNRLTRKVQDDFHRTYAIALPKRSRRWFFQKAETDLETLEDC